MKTKILATIGPASNKRDVLSKLIAAGVRIFRLNFSHGDSSSFVDLIKMIRELEIVHKTPITILQDLSGPKIRIGTFPNEGSLNVLKGDQLLLGPSSLMCNEEFPYIPFDHPEIFAELEQGDRLVLADGTLQFRVVEHREDGLFKLEANNNGIVTSRKGLALPGKSIPLPALTEKDKKDLVDGLALGVDAVALSFVQSPEDIREAKSIIRSHSDRDIPVIAKLERRNAVDRLDAILKEVDIVMVARGDLGITYDEDVLRLADIFRSSGFLVGAVVLTQYSGQPAADQFRRRLNMLGITCKLHYPIEGYPHDIDLIVSEEGYGKNEFVETTRPLVVVTAPGPGSGKLATCLSQLYHEHKRGVAAGYAKFETFPVWNLPLNHPVNIAYEAATVDLDDANIIDPFHLEAHGQTTVNYNRDVEAFPVVKALMEKILGESPYQSPTDMGVNMVGYAICDDEACREAARMEIVRRYFTAASDVKRTGSGQEQVDKLKAIMQKVGVTTDQSPARSAALLKEQTTGAPAGAMVLPDGSVVTGKTSTRLGAASSLMMNALKAVTGVDMELEVISNDAIEPISRLKTSQLGSANPRLHPEETLIALSITSASSEIAERVLAGLPKLRGCDAFFSVIISSSDEALFKKLGINVCCEPKFERRGFFHR